MVGFGHSWTDSATSVFNTLDNDTLANVLSDLFGQNGNNMGFMRHTIGSSDLSGDQYTYDDNGPSFNEGEPDLYLSHFSLGPYGTAQAEFIARMGSVKVMSSSLVHRGHTRGGQNTTIFSLLPT